MVLSSIDDSAKSEISTEGLIKQQASTALWTELDLKASMRSLFTGALASSAG